MIFLKLGVICFRYYFFMLNMLVIELNLVLLLVNVFLVIFYIYII